MPDAQDFPLKVEENLTLNLVKVEDAEELFQVVDENRVHLQRRLPWVPNIKTVEDEVKALEKNVQEFAEGKGLELHIRYNGSIVGRMGLHYINWEDRRTEIGYWLAESAEGKGIMTRACKVLIDYLFGTLKFHRVEIRVAPQNTKSKAIPNRLGFVHEGTLKEASLLNGRYTDLEIWRILEQEWDGQ